MLQSIRDTTQGWIAGVIISLLILSFALWGIHSYVLGAGDNNVVAKVNGTEITKNQLSVAYERLRRQAQMQFGSNQLPEHAESTLKKRALQTLIDFQVLDQASFANDYRITGGQIDSFLQGMPEFQVNGEFSPVRFQQVLNATLFTPSDFIELIKTTLLIDQSRLGIIFTSIAMPNEINATMALIGQERNIQYLLIPQNFFNSQQISISDEKVNAYYKDHQDEFKTPEQVSIEYILLSIKDLASKINPSEDQLKNFYNENINSFIQPAKWQLEEVILPVAPNVTGDEFKKSQAKMNEIVKAANKGTEFKALIKEYSLVTGDNKLTEWVSLSQIPPALQKSVANLTKQGQVSAPITTDKGFVLLKAVNYKEPQTNSYAISKEKVKELFATQKAEEQFADQREKVANITYEHPDSLQAAAKELALPVQTTALFTRDKAGTDLSANGKVREAAFGNDVLNLQNNSDVIQIDSQSAVVLRVKSHIPASVIDLKTVRSQIENKLKAISIEDKLLNLANEIKSKLQTGSSINQVSNEYHLQWNNVGFIGRHANKIDQAILDRAFQMPSPQNANKVTYSFAKVANGFAVIALSGVKPGNSNVSKEQYQAFSDQIQSSQGTLEYELYKNSLMKKSKIVIE